MSEKDEDEQNSKLFMTETSQLEGARRPKSSKINSATTADLRTVDDPDEDDNDEDDDDLADDQADDDDMDDDGDYDDYMDEYPENPFYEYQLPEQPGHSQVIYRDPSASSYGEREQIEEEVRPISAVAPKIFHQQDDGTAHIEISSTPAFQCLEEVFKLFLNRPHPILTYFMCLSFFKMVN